MIVYLCKFIIAIFIAILCTWLYTKYSYPTIPAQQNREPKNPKRSIKWGIILIATCLSIYSLLAFLLSLSWLGGDDLFFPHNVSLAKHIEHAIGKYCNGVSRLGETIVCLTGVSENRWQQFLLTPIFICLLPFSIFRLVKHQNHTIFSAKGTLFYLFIISILLIQLPGNDWRNFRCYAASANYLWPLVIIALFLSYYRSDQQFSTQKLFFSTTAMFLMGIYVGWSVECISCLILPALLITCIVKTIRRRCYIPQFAGFVGALFGVFFIFSSPALSKRVAWASDDSPFNIADMSFREAFDFACSITPQNIDQLAGAAIPAYIGDFPLILRPLFFPELLSTYLPFCAIPLVTCLILLVPACVSASGDKKRVFTIALSGIGISFLCASTYLVACIPYSMSFLPASFFIIAVAGFLFLRTSTKINACTSIPAFACLLCFLIPPTLEAYELQPARDAQLRLIHEQIDSGKKDILLPYPLPFKPKDRLCIIRNGIFSESTTDYPNHLACTYFKIDSIRTLPPKCKEKHQQN